MKNGSVIYFLLLLTQPTVAQTKIIEEQIIRDLRKASNLALAKKDIAGLSKFWLNDFVQVRGNGSYLAGRDTIIKVWQDTFRTKPETSFIRTPTEVAVNDVDGMIAWEKGTWQGINTYSKGGSYSAMWRKKGGEWKIQAELFVALH
jgi:uncharacterized protein (TIGR02246 family)